MKMPRYYTTGTAPTTTVNHICRILRQHGCTRYMIVWDAKGDEPEAIEFSMPTPILDTPIPIRLTAQVEGIARRMKARTDHQKAQARRTAWRQLRGWIEMSLEMSANGVKPFHEIFMADVVLEDGRRVAEMFEAQAPMMLGAGE